MKKIFNFFTAGKNYPAYIFFCFFILVNTCTQALPRVKILATGGTIAGAGSSAERAGYKAGALPIDELLNAPKFQ